MVTESAPANGHHAASALVRTQRALQILRQLQTGQPWTAVELAEQFQCSTRTIARDIKLLNACGIPIECPPGERGLRLGHDFFWQPVRPTLEEMIALVLATRLAGRELPGDLGKHLEIALAKLVGSARPAVRRRLTELTARIDPPHHPHPALPNLEFLPLLLGQIAAHQEVRLFVATAAGPLREVVLVPRLLTVADGAWHLVAAPLEGGPAESIPIASIARLERLVAETVEMEEANDLGESEDEPLPPEAGV